MATSQPTFVYIEDDPSSRQIVQILITRVMKLDHLILWNDSTDLRNRLEALPVAPTVFFLDIQMKPYDGYAVLQILRETPRFTHATIIAMTANVMSHDVERLKQVGFDGLIGKPIIKEAFPGLVERILAGHSVWFIP
jgi:CheY-like chemotaxis protein